MTYLHPAAGDDQPDTVDSRSDIRPSRRAAPQATPPVRAKAGSAADDYRVRPNSRSALDQWLRMCDEIDRRRAEVHILEQDLDQVMAERDNYHEWADALAYHIAPQAVIGEHSSCNNPWANALDQA